MSTLSIPQKFQQLLQNLTPTQGERDQAASHRASVESALSSSFTVNRFFQSGSFTHGTGVRGHCDVDAIVSLGGLRPATPYEALQDLEQAMRIRFASTSVGIDRPAVQVRFAAGRETWELVPAYLFSTNLADFVYQIPGPSVGEGWMLSSPDAHLAYVNEANKRPDGGAKALARLLKGWKYANEVPISSFYLEMRAAMYMRTQSTFIPYMDTRIILQSLWYDQCASVADPSGLADTIRAFSSEENRTSALKQLLDARIYAELAEDAYGKGDTESSSSYWSKVFGWRFPQ